MHTDQIRLVQESFAQMVPIADTAAELFYGRLFELDPELRHLFHGDMRQQGRKLMQMLAVAVAGLGDLNTLLPAVQALGRRHAGYGVTSAHYTSVATALLWTLEQGLGSGFTADVRDAWIAVYGILATTMQTAAQAEDNQAQGLAA